MGLFDYRQWDLIEVATSYRDFGVPYSLAVEFICSKVNVGEEIVERVCQQVYYLSKD